MSAVPKSIKMTEGSPALYVENRTAKFPFLKHSGEVCHRYVVDVDFSSGDSLELRLYGASKILFAVAKTPSGTLLTITESTVAGSYIQLATGTSTTDIEVFIIYEV